MQLLLDTHAFLWWVADHPNLSSQARQAIADPGNECFVSLASCWEIAIKSSLGKLQLGRPLDRFIPEQLRLNQFQLLGVELAHVLRVNELPWHHRDPFDRLLIAQCQVESMTLVSVDQHVVDYEISTLW